uniref:Collagen alpha-1(X) chain-like n=1 Tax=Lepisosteus oculatus TaxID=7918 RepID=W5MSB8_LEPOC|nr:PREDICTED: collagen alpha-1(X) chain-like isoform X1 [Lepisosteus oculatus]
MTHCTTGLTMKTPLLLLCLQLLWPLCGAMITPHPPPERGGPEKPPNPPPNQDYHPMNPADQPHIYSPQRFPLTENDPFPGNISSRSFVPDMSQTVGLEPDMSYCQMLLESPVPPPIESVPWFCLCMNCKGTMGPKGDRGERGLPGHPGSPGPRGFSGFRGRPGFVGRQGLKGQKGDDGEKGDQGVSGFRGAKGERGLKGDKGDQGLDGIPGLPGPQGEPGQCPVVCQGDLGLPGMTGLPGPAGVRGPPGADGVPGHPGQKGDMGSIGAPGPQGTQGPKGEHGAEGQCNCTDGEKGAHGEVGPQGPPGNAGHPGAKGEAGLPGTKGEKGDEGLRGVPGPCSPTIQSGFSAALDSIYPAPNRPVPFGKVIYNLQGHFDPFNGIYMAPVNGTYVFSYQLVVFSKVLKVGLFLNFKPVVKTTEPSDLGSASQMVVLQLSRGDRVWLQVKDTSTNGMYASSDSTSTFSGYLLYPDSCEMPLSRDFPTYEEGDYSWGDEDEPPTRHSTTPP